MNNSMSINLTAQMKQIKFLERQTTKAHLRRNKQNNPAIS